MRTSGLSKSISFRAALASWLKNRNLSHDLAATIVSESQAITDMITEEFELPLIQLRKPSLDKQLPIRMLVKECADYTDF